MGFAAQLLMLVSLVQCLEGETVSAGIYGRGSRSAECHGLLSNLASVSRAAKILNNATPGQWRTGLGRGTKGRLA